MNAQTFFVAYNTHRANGDFDGDVRLLNHCTCNGWDTHHCLHFDNLTDARAAYDRLDADADADLAARRAAMLR